MSKQDKKSRPRVFRMKQFEVSDSHSGCKIGVDATLLGSWVQISEDARRALDVGCGCGIISLMLAQRGPQLHVTAIDIDEGALQDAGLNISNSIFSDRVVVDTLSFDQMIEKNEKYDLIVSNPPYFESGGDPNLSARMLARHVGSLSPEILIRRSPEILSPGGELAFIAPSEYLRKYLQIAREMRLRIKRICYIKGGLKVACKRVILQFIYCSDVSDGTLKSVDNNPFELRDTPLRFDTIPIHQKTIANPTIEHLIIRDEHCSYTEKYITLGKDFYLKF